ncbi:hypothetical protein [Bacillus multifaciens]|nr:hypothetical protein [Bacillus sp. WLY-B-L8]MDP7981468.1 hypothetical protein [Bacillus sp. WLY-B-L8]
MNGSERQEKVGHLSSKEVGKNEDAAVCDNQEAKRRMARMAYMQQLER